MDISGFFRAGLSLNTRSFAPPGSISSDDSIFLQRFLVSRISWPIANLVAWRQNSRSRLVPWTTRNRSAMWGDDLQKTLYRTGRKFHFFMIISSQKKFLMVEYGYIYCIFDWIFSYYFRNWDFPPLYQPWVFFHKWIFFNFARGYSYSTVLPQKFNFRFYGLFPV